MKEAMINTTSANEHVPEIERRIKVIKERTRAEKASLPYTYLPIVMVAELINHVITWLNVFSAKTGVGVLSPRLIVMVNQLAYSEHCRCTYGTYVQTHEEGSNDTDEERTVDAMCLGPTGNNQ